MEMTWPPTLPGDQFESLITAVKDWQLTHGSLLKSIDLEENDDDNTIGVPVGVTLFPTLFPEELFHKAHSLQHIFNKLYAAVASDEEFLKNTLKDLIEADDFTRALWHVHDTVKRTGGSTRGLYAEQSWQMGILRSDYMLHELTPRPALDDYVPRDDSKRRTVELRQVEVNTVACAGGIHSDNVSKMQCHLCRAGSYVPNATVTNISLRNMPRNETLKSFVSGLKAAHKLYGSQRSPKLETCILMIVQPNNYNIADERPIEYALWQENIPVYRVEFGTEVLEQTEIGASGRLLYRPRTGSAQSSVALEVSVVYYRAGFEPREYEASTEFSSGHWARVRLEGSIAIKCPSILGQLAGSKKVQQALTTPDVLLKYLSPEDATAVMASFTSMYPMDDSADGVEARKLATNPATCSNYILKPSRDGGGHNVYGEDIPAFLQVTPEHLWKTYILMQKIRPPILENVSISPAGGRFKGPVISELGIFGILMWENSGGKLGDMMGVKDEELSWSFKTKNAALNEMSVVKGYGCFDSPYLVDMETFLASSHPPEAPYKNEL